jgi:hypothetical protein
MRPIGLILLVQRTVALLIQIDGMVRVLGIHDASEGKAQ